MRRLPPVKPARRLVGISCARFARAYATKNTGPKANEPSKVIDDYYALLLAEPLPNPMRESIKPRPSVPESKEDTSSGHQILFSAPLTGPSARVRGLTRGEQGLAKPSEPDNCCMSGCVNCVWDTYREEIEEWAAGRRKRDAQLGGTEAQNERQDARIGEGSASGDEDAVGGLWTYAEADINNDDDVFQSIPVGIREFMKQEKRLQEKRARQ